MHITFHQTSIIQTAYNVEMQIKCLVDEMNVNPQKTSTRDRIIKEVISDSVSIEKELKTMGLLASDEPYEQLTILNIYNKIKNSIKPTPSLNWLIKKKLQISFFF